MRRYSTDSRAINKFKVPQKEWGKWTLVARHVFNKTYESMVKSPDMFRSPEDQKTEVSPNDWKVTAWNASWIAASVCAKGEKYLLKDLELKVKG